MSEQVLTDDEKNALLDGVSSGEIEVQSASGTQYAAVRDYVIGPRARLTSNSLPRLASMNEQFASLFGEACGGLLQADVEVSNGAIRRQGFAEFCDLWPSRSLATTFTAAPLTGEALLAIDSVLIGPMVEAFFGGNSPESVAHNEAAHSPGGIGTSRLIVGEALAVLGEVFSPLMRVTPEVVATRVGLDLVETIAPADEVIVCEFELALPGEKEQRGTFCVVWPEATIAPLRAALEGKRRDRDVAEDARWERSLRARLTDVVVPLSSNVGHARMTLGQLVALKPGDVIGIDTPRVATVLAHGVALLEGRFGIQAGRNAVEAVSWLDTDSKN